MLTLPLIRSLWVTAGVLIAGHVVTLVAWVQLGVRRDVSLARQFDLNGEANFASWFESVPLLVGAALAFTIASHLRVRRTPLAGRWTVLAAVLLLMTVDEAAQLHDMVSGPLRRQLGIDGGILHFAWVLPALAFLAVGAAYFVPLVRSLPATVQLRLTGVAAVYFGGAVLVEMISGRVAENGHRTTPYLAVLTIEESCEIIGALLAVGALFALLRSIQPRTIVVLDATGAVRLGPADLAGEQEPPHAAGRGPQPALPA